MGRLSAVFSLVIIMFCLMTGQALGQKGDPAKTKKDVEVTKQDVKPADAAGGCAGCGACGGSIAVLIAIPIIAFILNIAILIWVAKDAKARNMDSSVLWMALVFFTGLLGLIIYLFSRPSGNLMTCRSCGNKRLQASRRCPHCGNTGRRSRDEDDEDDEDEGKF
jgi:hypothetical protein